MKGRQGAGADPLGVESVDTACVAWSSGYAFIRLNGPMGGMVIDPRVGRDETFGQK